MVIAFFRNNIQHVKQLTDNINCCAFWYSKGLSSYKFIDTVLTVESIKIEKSIYEDFKAEYPQLIQKYNVELFEDIKEGEQVSKPNKKICFFASNDTIISSFSSVLKYLKKTEYDVFCRSNENAAGAGKKIGIEAKEIRFSIPNPENYSLLVMGNDWGPLERKINIDFISKKINTVCIQESSIDFNPIYGKMRNCSFPVFQGVATLENINIEKKITAVIGNPRFENLRPTPIPADKLALVNVNFTYGVFEDYRDIWVNDVVDTCKEHNINYLLSQHPRDNGDFTGYNLLKSNPLLVHDNIRGCSVLISRFSALLTEAICLGRPCIYYNPHGEELHYKFNADDVMFFYATNKEELSAALKKITEAQSENTISESDFLEKHLGNTMNGKASEYISMLLNDLTGFTPIKRVSIVQRLSIRLEIAKLILRGRSY